MPPRRARPSPLVHLGTEGEEQQQEEQQQPREPGTNSNTGHARTLREGLLHALAAYDAANAQLPAARDDDDYGHAQRLAAAVSALARSAEGALEREAADGARGTPPTPSAALNALDADDEGANVALDEPAPPTLHTLAPHHGLLDDDITPRSRGC